ncbi:MAG: hypothetical protein OEZ13_03095 [Spirochaetia bacterium]|nr:hypothetical protein [Spirochaetia bacterium]
MNDLTNRGIKLSAENEVEDTDDYEKDEDDTDFEEVIVSYACEDCDYRWEVTLDEEEAEYDDIQYCPMCGTANTTQI